jgi:hypothetical protein
VLEKLAAIQMLDLSFPTIDGRRLIMPRCTEPNPEQVLLLPQLKLVIRNDRLKQSPLLPRQIPYPQLKM